MAKLPDPEAALRVMLTNQRTIMMALTQLVGAQPHSREGEVHLRRLNRRIEATDQWMDANLPLAE